MYWVSNATAGRYRDRFLDRQQRVLFPNIDNRERPLEKKKVEQLQPTKEVMDPSGLPAFRSAGQTAGCDVLYVEPGLVISEPSASAAFPDELANRFKGSAPFLFAIVVPPIKPSLLE